MAYLLRFLNILMLVALILTALVGFNYVDLGVGHIRLAILSFIFAIFAQAFIMFFFIGVSRLTKNVEDSLINNKLDQLFDETPPDLTPYLEKIKYFVLDSDRFKKQIIPWTILMLILGSIAFLLGGAYDTGLVQKTTHTGVVYGFLVSMLIGIFKQWVYLGKAHFLLRDLKTLFQIPHGSM